MPTPTLPTLHGHTKPPAIVVPRVPPAPCHWSVGGKSVEMEWSSFEATAAGGYGQLRDARVFPRRGRRVKMWQGDVVEARRPNGRICYQGKLTAPPKYVDQIGIITAMGPRTVIDGFTDRLPYQIRGGDQWQSLDADPANYSAGIVEGINATQKGNSIGVVFSAATYANGDRNGFYLWVDGYNIQRVAGTMRERGTVLANYDLRIRHATPFNAATTDATFTQGAGNPDGTTFDVAVPTGFSVAIIDWAANAAVSPTANKHFHIDNLRVGIITDQDSFTAAQVASDVANRCGYAVSATGSLNVLPLDWNSPATELMDYLAGLEDACWLVVHSGKPGVYGRLIFRPFGHTQWKVALRDGSAVDQGLEILPLYDAISTTYESPPGMPQHVRSKASAFGIPDPLPGFTADYPDPIQLQDPQPDSTLALAVNERALQRLTKLRVQGNVLITRTQERQPFDILPGDTLKLGDFEPHPLPPQRIASVTYNADGTVVCSLTRDLRLDSIVNRLANRRIRRHHRRHR